MNRVTKEIISGDLKGALVFQDEGVTKTIPEFKPGIYHIKDIGSMFSVQIVYEPNKSNETYIEYLGGTVATVLKKAATFFSEPVKSKYSDLGIAHKTGVILEGPPGTGKTVTAHIIMRHLVNKYNAICLIAGSSTKPGIWKKALREVKDLNKPIVLFIDECEDSFYHYESDWLTFLDGHESFVNFMFIGCTNHINRISDRLKRPSRIEHIVNVDSIEATVAEEYVKAKLPKIDSDLRAGLAYEAVEAKATMDVFKHAIKEFYIYTDAKDIKVFKEILNTLVASRKFVKEEDD